MSKPISLALLIIGAVLLAFGVSATEAFASEVSEAVSGSPTDKAIWLLVGGIAALVVGGLGLLRGAASGS